MNITIDGYNINYKITGPEGAEKTAVILQGWGTGMDLYDFAAAASMTDTGSCSLTSRDSARAMNRASRGDRQTMRTSSALSWRLLIYMRLC
jgi:hypothetical protein